MEIYLVGGAVRDQLLNLPIKERDWVVVGATPQMMFDQGFKQVGRDFPVFLHPKTHEEYALARTERKTGKGYTQFTCVFDPNVTLVEDLMRRDLTINAMAQTTDGKLIDPFGGAQDLKNHVLRHVSAAFAEDPVRILRVARFAARFEGFYVHHETNQLMKKMLDAGEVDALVPERVWQELERTLYEDHPHRFFEVLKDCQVLSKLFPEIAKHFSSSLAALMSATTLSKDPKVRFAALLGNLNNQDLQALCQRYRVPSAFRDLANLVAKYHTAFSMAEKLTAVDLLAILEHCDAFRRPKRFEQWLLALSAASSRTKAQSLSNVNHLRRAYQAAINIDISQIIAQNSDGELIREQLHQARIRAILSGSIRNVE